MVESTQGLGFECSRGNGDRYNVPRFSTNGINERPVCPQFLRQIAHEVQCAEFRMLLFRRLRLKECFYFVREIPRIRDLIVFFDGLLDHRAQLAVPVFSFFDQGEIFLSAGKGVRVDEPRHE